MCNLRAIVRATQHRALALKSAAKASRKLRDAEKAQDPRATIAATRALTKACNRARNAAAVLDANPMPGDL